MKAEVIVSVDMDADGPIPAVNSMLSLGAVAFSESGKELGSFGVNLEEYPGASPDPETMVWWKERGATYGLIRQNLVGPRMGMLSFAGWLQSLPGRARFLAAPVAYQFSWVRWYLCRYVGAEDGWHNAIDMRSFVMGQTGSYGGDYRKRIQEIARTLKLQEKTHLPIDDAREHGQLFFALRKQQLQKLKGGKA